MFYRRILETILREIRTMASNADTNLAAAVETIKGAVSDAVTKINDQAAKLANNDDPAVQAAADELTTLASNLESAVSPTPPADPAPVDGGAATV